MSEIASCAELIPTQQVDEAPPHNLEIVRAVPTRDPDSDDLEFLKASDKRELLTYFDMGGVSGTFSSSTMGVQLERCERYAFHARPCKRCGGDRQKHTGGIGFICSTRKGRVQSEQQRMALELLGIFLPPGAADKVCDKCHGRGWVPPKRLTRGWKKTPLTARPTGSSKHGLSPSVSVGDSDMATIGNVSKRLGEVRACDAACAQALESWFGTQKDDGGQSVRALWPHTPAGKTLLRRNHLELPPLQFFENERKHQYVKPDANRQSLFDAADKQGDELWQKTRRLWNSTAPLARQLALPDTEAPPVTAE